MIDIFTSENNIENSITAVSRKKLVGSCKSHFHEFYEIEYIISGTGKYIIDGVEHPIEAGRIFFMSPVNFHRVADADAEIFNVMFSGGACDLYFLAKLAIDLKSVTYKAKDGEKMFFESVLGELIRYKDDFEMSSLLLTGIVAKLGKVMSRTGKFKMSVSQKVILYMITNFRTRISLKDAAAFVGVAPPYLSELFKKQTGMGFKQYVDSVRFENARNLLLHTDMSITQICIESGFDDYANFIRRFGERYGESPSKYRRSNDL